MFWSCLPQEASVWLALEGAKACAECVVVVLFVSRGVSCSASGLFVHEIRCVWEKVF